MRNQGIRNALFWDLQRKRPITASAKVDDAWLAAMKWKRCDAIEAEVSRLKPTEEKRRKEVSRIRLQ
jgi:hypothetical protein